MNVAVKSVAIFAFALFVWTLAWVAICSFTMWHLSLPNTWEPMGRLMFIVLGSVIAGAAAAVAAEC